jgi:glycosyltransferase involved in cell wall biosynthesis
VSLHAFEIHDRRYVDGFTPLPLRGASAVFTESERDRSIVSERFGVEVTVAHLGVPTAWLEADPAVPREEDLIVAVGRLVEKKGYPVLLRAVAAATTPWRLRIIGEGPDRPELERLCRELGLTDRVSLPGAGSEAEVQGALRSASIACLASVETASGDRDGTPMALIESMASGAAVVAADTGSIAELLGDAGIVVPAGDVTALAAALDELADPTRRAELGRRGRRRVAEGWTADRTAATVLDALSAAGPSR